MKNILLILVASSGLILCLACRQKISAIMEEPPRPQVNAFEAYLAAPDTHFRYEPVDVREGEQYTFHVIKLTSQAWLTKNELADSLWWHWVTLVVPQQVISDTAFLWIGSGNREREAPSKPDPVTQTVALETNTIGIYVHNIPNQPLNFKDDAFGERYEDELISFGWRQYLLAESDSSQARWLARLPMTKAVIRAMDAVNDYGQSVLRRDISHFTVAGASKRGWTTWTTGAMDDRVVAIVPVVIDMLNVVPSFEHHWQAYGFWAPAVDDYVREGIMDMQYTSAYQNLIDLVEPFSYRHRMTMPKLLINAAGDQFFLPDSWQFYWDSLIGEKHLRYIPNTDHSLNGSDAIHSLSEFHRSIIDDRSRPKYEWAIEDEEIRLQIDSTYTLDSLQHWSIHNRTTRDFRLETLGPNWRSRLINTRGQSHFTVEITIPPQGWSAHFLELVFNDEKGPRQKFTTGIKVLPDSLPFPPFQTKPNLAN